MLRQDSSRHESVEIDSITLAMKVAEKIAGCLVAIFLMINKSTNYKKLVPISWKMVGTLWHYTYCVPRTQSWHSGKMCDNLSKLSWPHVVRQIHPMYTLSWHTLSYLVST